MGDTVRKARHKTKLPQAKPDEKLHIGLHSVVDIENYRSIFTMKTLYPLITMLHINPSDIFTSDHTNTSNVAAPALTAKLTTCSKEVILLNEICEAALPPLRNPKAYSVYKQK